jgi:polysaccharide chain length determinant protein (PEP-CTERM system associated)
MKQNSPDPITQAKESWQIILDFRWYVLLVGVALSALFIVAISLMPNKYEATTTVLVDPQKIPEKYVSMTTTSDPLRLGVLTQEVLSSSRLEQVIDRLQLFSEARKTHSREEIIDCLRKGIKVEAKQGGDRTLSVFTITYSNGNPQKVAQVANQLASGFIEWSLRMRESQTSETTQFLNVQLQEARKNVDELEGKLDSYKMQHLGELPEQLPANLQALSRLQESLHANADALTRLDREKMLLQQAPESSRAQPRAAMESDRRYLEDEQQKLKEHLADLRTRYSDEHPEVQQTTAHLAQVQAQIRALAPAAGQAASSANGQLGVVVSEMKRLQEEQQHILSQVNQYQARVDATPLREQEIAALSREYQDTKAHYQGLLDKTYSADLATNMERNQASGFFTIIEPAHVPDKPISPHRLPLFGMAIPFCFALSIGIVIIREKAKGAVRTERELRLLLPNATPILGNIPMVASQETERRMRQVAAIAVSGSLTCVLAVAAFLWIYRTQL